MKHVSIAIIAASLALFAARVGCMTWMPGTSFSGAKPPLSAQEQALSDSLERRVSHLAITIGERNAGHPEALAQAGQYVEQELTSLGLTVSRENYQGARAGKAVNLVAELPGATRPAEIILVGAHYDSAPGSPGADDNATGVAALLELRLRGVRLERTVRLVAFANEEPPFFQTREMGSVVYAAGCRERHEAIALALVFDGLGYFTTAPHSQRFPAFPFNVLYPTEGSFLAFVSNSASATQLREVVGAFRHEARVGSRGAVMPGITGAWSDQWSFWERGYPGVLATDTLPFRYPHYHSARDLPEHLDYAELALVVEGLDEVVREVASPR
jgi:hypothetical protein